MNLALHPFELRMRYPFTIARGTAMAARTLVVELQQDGLRGYGEAPESAYYGATIATMMIGCFGESTVGISGAAQLLPLADYADLDGALLLAEDIATGVRIEEGQVVFPEEAGCGVRLYSSRSA